VPQPFIAAAAVGLDDAVEEKKVVLFLLPPLLPGQHRGRRRANEGFEVRSEKLKEESTCFSVD
jgi:hypothetical protein